LLKINQETSSESIFISKARGHVYISK